MINIKTFALVCFAIWASAYAHTVVKTGSSDAFFTASAPAKGGNRNVFTDEQELCDPNEFFPCSNTISGNIILIFMYGCFLCAGAKLISDGSELMMEVSKRALMGNMYP